MLTGDRYFDSKDFMDILSSYENSIRTGHPIYMDANDLTDIADYYNLTGNKKEADRVIDYALQLSPNATLPLVYKAREALANNDHQKARELAERIDDKEDPDYKYLKVELLIARNEIEEAEKLLRVYFKEIDKEEQEDFILDVANIYIDYRICDMAFEWMCKCRKKGTEFKELMARILFGLERFEESAKLFDELIDTDPYSKKYWAALASAQFMSCKFNEAITSCDYAIAIDPDDPECILTKANAQCRLNNHEDALENYKRYCEKVTDDELGLLNIATCLINLERFSEAITYLERACRIAGPYSEHLIDIYREFAFAYSSIKMADKALECLEKSKEKDADETDFMVLKGHILLENDRPEEAGKVFKKAIRQSDDSHKTILKIIVSLFDNKYVKQAYRLFKKLEDSTGKELEEGYSYMALCCLDLKLTDEFLKYLNLATKNNKREAKRVLGHMFPMGIEPEDYYTNIIKRLKLSQE